MNKVISKYNNFLEDIKDQSPVFIESIQKAFNIIFESTEDVVEKVKDNHPDPVDELVEPSDINIGTEYEEFQKEEELEPIS